MKLKPNLSNIDQIVEFSCISCNERFEAYSTYSEEVMKMDVCGNCHTFYTGKSSSDIKTGKIEVFNQRERKVREKSSLKK